MKKPSAGKTGWEKYLEKELGNVIYGKEPFGALKTMDKILSCVRRVLASELAREREIDKKIRNKELARHLDEFDKTFNGDKTFTQEAVRKAIEVSGECLIDFITEAEKKVRDNG